MDYTARIQALKNLRGAIATKATHSAEDVISFSGTIDTWKGGVSQEGFYDLMKETKDVVKKIHSTHETVMSAIDSRISDLKALIEQQYNQYKFIVTHKYDDDPIENKKMKRKALNNLSFLDSSVKARLRRQI